MRNRTVSLVAILAFGATSLAQQNDILTGQAPPPRTPDQGINTDLPAANPRLTSTRLPALRAPIHTAVADLGIAYGLWAAGDAYKVSFHDGMTFVPYLGSSYPENQPLHWRTKSAKLGDLELVTVAQPEPVHTDYRCEYQLGGIVEAYDVLTEGLEQTFVLQALPQAGDLVIRGLVTSPLAAKAAAPAHQELLFADANGHQMVSYGRAFAIDAAGNRLALATGFADGVVTLTVPAQWLATAQLPIVVDPLLARVQVATWGTSGTGQPESVDIGRDDNATTSNMMICYTRAASSSDFDLWCRLTNEDYSNNSLVFSDITASWSTDTVRCAYVGGSNKWAVVFRRYFPSPQFLSQIRCHVHASGDTSGTLTNYGSLVPPTNNNDWRPDVGGVEAFATGNHALVVFQREDNTSGSGNFSNSQTSEIHASLLDTTTTNGTFGTTFVVASGSSFDSERPSVNQVAEGGSSFSWIVGYQQYNNGITNDDWDILCKRIDNTGTMAGGSFVSPLATGATVMHQLGPVVEGQSGRYMVTFTTADTSVINFKTGLITGYDIYTERFDWASTATSPTVKPPVFQRGNSTRIWETTGNAYDTNDDSHWATGFRAVSPGSPTAYYSRTGYFGIGTEGPVGSVLYNSSGHTTTEVGCTFNNDFNLFHYAYGVDDGTATQPIYGHTLEYVAPAGTTVNGSSCSSMNLGWTGNRQIGAEFNRLTFSGAPAGSLHVPQLSLATLDVPVVHPAVNGGCRLLVNTGAGYLGQLSLAIGASGSYTIPIPEPLPSFTLYVQDWFLDPSSNRFSSSQRLSVPMIK